MTPASHETRENTLLRPVERRSLTVAGVRVDDVAPEDIRRFVCDMVSRAETGCMTVVNASKLVLATRDRRLAEAIQEADIVTADGMSVVWASKVLGKPLGARVTGIDTLENLITLCASAGYSVYFLGSRPEAVSAAVEHFAANQPELKVAGYRDGYFDEARSAEVAEEIRKSRADLLFVGMGSPKQELWIQENLRRTGVCFALGVGGSFDHFSGLVKRAPPWMQRWGLEWLHRLAMEPGRLWRRYLVGNTLFIWLVVRQVFSRSATPDAK